MNPKNLETISYASMAVIVVSLFFIGMEITGYAVTETGTVNVTIDSTLVLNFTTALLDFKNGTVTSNPATVYSNGTTSGGTWAAVNGELVLANIGNIDANITLRMNDTAANFIGGTGAEVQAYVTDTVSACTDEASQVFNPNFAEINTTAQLACSNLSYVPGSNSINIDFGLIIPIDASGAKTVGIEATGEAI